MEYGMGRQPAARKILAATHVTDDIIPIHNGMKCGGLGAGEWDRRQGRHPVPAPHLIPLSIASNAIRSLRNILFLTFADLYTQDGL